MRGATAIALLATWSGLLACGGSQSSPEAPAQVAPADTPARPQLTVAACEASGGTVVGDNGDGAIHRPDYRCPNYRKPNAVIRAPEGEPIAVEGSVCCPQ